MSEILYFNPNLKNQTDENQDFVMEEMQDAKETIQNLHKSNTKNLESENVNKETMLYNSDSTLADITDGILVDSTNDIKSTDSNLVDSSIDKSVDNTLQQNNSLDENSMQVNEDVSNSEDINNLDKSKANIVEPNEDESEYLLIKPKVIYKLSEFEGPLDLLLTLIKNAKINIEEIFVSDVTANMLKLSKIHQKKNLILSMPENLSHLQLSLYI